MKNALVAWAVNILYPRRCPVCQDIVMPAGKLICPECIKKISWVKQPVCKKCGKEIADSAVEYCFSCSSNKRSFEAGMALINYDDVAKRAMSQIKYNNKREYLDFFAAAAALKFNKRLRAIGADALIPVPVHPARRRKRGFNQAEILAEKLGSELGIAVYKDAMIRRKNTEPQKDLNAAERLKNLEQAFEAGNIRKGLNTAILVDDIYTTGSTIEACTRVLKNAGVKKVYFISLCIGREQ